MKRFNLIKEYPGYKIPTMAVQQIDGDFKVEGHEYDHVDHTLDYFTSFPEHWQEIREPLFVTEDGVEVFDPSTLLWDVHVEQFEIDCNRFDETDKIKAFKFFSTKEAAEKWIERNKPKFSIQQIEEGYIKSINARTGEIQFGVFREYFGI